MPRSYIHVGQVENAAGTRHAMPRVTNALSQVNRFHKDILLNRETEQQKRRMSQVSRWHLSIKALSRNPPEVRLTSGQKKPWRPS